MNVLSALLPESGVFRMNDHSAHPSDPASADAAAPPRKPLTPEAQRALAEAAERRAQAERDGRHENILKGQKEIQGPKGPEPTRYGDWERKGIASDF
jgi:hypothetical protein